nr:ABC transporter permease [Arcanobacterium phocae]
MSQRSAYAPWLLVPALLALCFLSIPLIAIFWRTPWAVFFELIVSQEATDALWLSLKTCLVSTAIATILGVPLAVVLARSRNWWSKLLRVIVLLPMVLPPVVAGLALLLTWGRQGLIGRYLELGGISISFSTLAVIFAQVFVSMPFLVMSFESAVQTNGNAYEDTARSLGADRSYTFFHVTLPILSPSLVSSIALAFSRALGEFGATITFAGSLQAVTRTMPLQIYLQREMDTDQALALAVVLIGLATLMLAIAGFSHRQWPLASWIRGHFRTSIPEKEYTNNALPSLSAPSIAVSAHVASRNVYIKTHFPAHSVTAVMGANGSGKSTLLGLIARSLLPSSGTVVFDPPRPRVVSLQQTPLLFPHLSVIANVEFGLRCAGMPRDKARQRALTELALVDMADFAHRRSTQLSGGQAQRIALARAMAINPDVVLLDEPFTALDETTTESLRQQLRARLSAARVTTIIVTHNVLDAEYIADSIVTLSKGRVISARKTRRAN